MRSSPEKWLIDVPEYTGRRLADKVRVGPSFCCIQDPDTIAASQVKDIGWRNRKFMESDAFAKCGEEYVGEGVAEKVRHLEVKIEA